MAFVGSAHSGTALAGPVAVLADMVARQRPDSRRLRQLIAILTEGPQDLAALVERCALPRQTVESVLSAAAGDLSWHDGKVMIQPGKAAAYRQRFGYEQLARTELADPLAGRYARAATVVTTMESLVAEAPPARTDLDHVPATPDTVVRRALWLDSIYDLTGSVLLFLGDHDLTSLAVGQVCPGADLVVVDIDEATLRFIDDQASRLGITVRCLASDLRIGLPDLAIGCADLVFTDPPYTPEGVELFVVRGLQGIGNHDNGRIIVAYGYSDRHPSLGYQAQSAAHRLGLAYEAVLPRFNHYTGAQAVGSTSALYVWRPTTRTWKALGRAGSGGSVGIYTQGTQAIETQQAGFSTVPAQVRAVTTDAGFPVKILIGSDWKDTGDRAAHLRLGTVLSGGVPAHLSPQEPAAAVADLSNDPGPWLLRALLATNTARLAALVPNGHRDLVSEAAQTSLADLLKAKYTLRFLRSQPDAKHAIVLAESVPPHSLDTPGRIAQHLLRRVHGKLGNVWREGLIEAAAEHGHALAKRPARTLVEARAYPPWALSTRLIDLPRHQIARILADAMASATDAEATGQPGG